MSCLKLLFWPQLLFPCYFQNLAAEKTYNNLDVTIEHALKSRKEVRYTVVPLFKDRRKLSFGTKLSGLIIKGGLKIGGCKIGLLYRATLHKKVTDIKYP